MPIDQEFLINGIISSTQYFLFYSCILDINIKNVINKVNLNFSSFAYMFTRSSMKERI